MGGEATDPIPQPAEPPEKGVARLVPLLGALVALAVSSGLIWWLATPARSPPAPAVALRPHTLLAPAVADPAQVQSAFEAVQDAYAGGAAQGLARANAGCAAALRADGRILDYCLAFDLFATAVAPEIARADADAARLAQAKAALPPGADPAARITEVRALMHAASLGVAPAPQRVERPEPSRRVAKAAPRPAPTHDRRAAERAQERRMAEARAAIDELFARAEAKNAARETADDETAPH